MTTLDRPQQIRVLLEKALQPTHLEIEDNSYKHHGHIGAQSGGGHYTISITSPHFTGKKMIECHRLIYAALGNMMEHEIHALSIKLL